MMLTAQTAEQTAKQTAKGRGTMQASEAADLEYVGFWIRVVATLIDTVLLLPVLFVVGYAMYGEGGAFQVQGLPAVFLNYILPALLVILFWNKRHATPGKMVFGARIVDARTGRDPSMRQHLIRYLGYFLSTFFFCLGFLWVAFDRRKQGWHDKLAGTVVVRSRKEGAEPVSFTG
jgi:uncharacterized RDD family membrane protein YckC